MSALMRYSRFSQVLTTLRLTGRCLSTHWQRIQDRQHVQSQFLEKQYVLKPTIQYQNVFYCTHATESTEKKSETVTEGTLKPDETVSAEKSASETVERSKRVGNKDLKNLNNVTIPSNFPASEFWKKFQFQAPMNWNKLENDLRILHDKGDYVSDLFFNRVMRATLTRDDYPEDLAMSLLGMTGRVGLKIPQTQLQKWTKYLDDKFHEAEPQYSVRYYNVVLKMMLENMADFSVLGFLSRMEKYNVAPNRVTLGRCLMKYAQSGDMEAANEILEHMKSTQMPVTKKVYQSIIQGHFRAGNYDTAMALFKDTKNVGFEMDSQAYHNAILGNVQANNLPVVKQLLQEAKETSVELTDRSLCSLIESSALFGKPEFCEFFLKELANVNSYYYNKAFETLVPVLRKGYFDVGYKFFSTLTDPHPAIMMNAMVFSNMPAKQEAQFLRSLKRDCKGGQNNLFVDYIGRCLQNFNHSSAIQMLPYLKEEHEALGHMGFYPLVLYFKNSAGMEGLKSCILPHMPVSMEMVALLEALWPVEMGSLMDALEKHSPLSSAEINALRLADVLSKEGPVKAANMLSSMSEVQDIPYVIENQKVSLLHRSVIKCHGYSGDIWRDQLTLVASLKEKKILLRVRGIVSSALKTAVDLKEIKDVILKHELHLTPQDLTQLKFDTVLTEEEKKKITQLEDVDYEKMSIAQLKAIAPFHAAKRGYQYKLLCKCGLARDYKTVSELLERNQWFANAKQFLVHRIRAEYAFKIKNDPMEAFTILKKCAEDSSMTLTNSPAYLVFRHNLALELWKTRHFEEAIEAFSFHSKSSDQTDIENRTTKRLPDFVWFSQAPQNFDQVLRVVSAMCEAGVFNVMYRRHQVLEKLLQAVKPNDLNQVLKMLPVAKELVGPVNPTWVVVIMDLLKPFLNNRTELKALYEECMKHFEEKTVLVALAAIHLEVTELVKFQKIIQTPGLILNPNMLKLVFLRWKGNNPTLIEEFADLTKGLPGNVREAQDLSELVYRCAKTDATEQDVEDCVQFFNEKFGNMAQKLRDRTVIKTYIAFLDKHKQPLPFDKDVLLDPIRLRQAQRAELRRQERHERFTETEEGDEDDGSIQLVDLLSTIKKH